MSIHITNSQARNLFLFLQGLSEPPARRLTREDLYALIVRMGFVQVDSIRTVERAHHLTLLSRNANYRPEMLEALHETDGLLFENWTHDASMIPTRWYRYWHPRFDHMRQRFAERESWQRRLGADGLEVIDRVRQHVQANGPVMSRDFKDERTPGMGTWWGWGPSKTALEYLWRTGELGVCRRVNFQKVYDLTERIIPEHHRATLPSREEYVDWACSTALERLGCATPGELAAYWAGIEPAEAREWCAQQVGQGIRAVDVEAADGSAPRPAFARGDILDLVRELPAPPSRVRFLSPFDPVIRDRKRALRLFNFDYRFEAFVPEPQRKYGYYVFPMLERDRFIGRIDLKYERRDRVLRVLGLWFEPGVRPSKGRLKLINAELERYGVFVGAEKLDWKTGTHPIPT